MKKARLYKIWAFAAGLLVSSGNAGAGTVYADMEVLESSGKGMTIVYRPAVSSAAQDNQGGEIDLLIPGHSSQAYSDGYILPLRNHLLAIPPEAQAVLTIQSRKFHSLNNTFPRKTKGDSNISGQSITAEAFDDFITISRPYRFRRNQVVKITLHPAVFRQSANRIDVAEEVRFTVNFIGGNDAGGVQEKNFQGFEDAVLNFEQSGKWSYPVEVSSSSPFPTGTLVKILVNSEGIYRVNYSDLSNKVSGLGDYPLDLIKIYNNGGRELPTFFSAPTVDSLIENALYVYDSGNDNIFESGDYLLFYGRGTWGWEQASSGNFEHYINHYTESNVYWLELNQSGSAGKRMADFSDTTSASVNVVTTRARVYREDEQVIYANSDWPGSGMNWYGDLISSGGSKTYYHTLNDVTSGYYRIRVFLHSTGGTAKFYVYWNNQLLGEANADQIKTFTGQASNFPMLSALKFESFYGPSSYVDWYEIEFERELQTEGSGESIVFQSPTGAGIAQYDSLYGLSGNAYIFDVTDFAEAGMTRGNRFKDDLPGSGVKRYIACDEAGFKSAGSISSYTPPPSDFTDLRDAGNSAEYLYIAHNDFYAGLGEVMPLWNGKGFNCKRVDVQQIYDQFSCGLYDPAAIRNFLRYAVDNWSEAPVLVALVGDGDYDFMNRISDADKNWIPVYEIGGTCYDDYYAYLHNSSDPELGLGRWTVRSTAEFDIVKDKVLKYAGEPEFGPWRMKFTVVADDEFGPGGDPDAWEEYHTEYSEDLCNNYVPDFFSVDKIYATEYPLTPGAGGRQKLEATEDLLNSINDGTVFVNYFGHGNETVWAHENLFYQERDLPNIDNGYRLSYFVAMTCSWAYFDNPEKQSMPEEMLVMPGEGAIGCIGATRSTGPTSNWALAEWLYTNVYEDPHTPKPLGQSMMNAKIVQSSTDSREYHIIGDPMVPPCAPINGGEISSIAPDSLFALNEITVAGRAMRGDTLWGDFTGTVYLQVTDAAIPTTYQFAESGDLITYNLPGNTIYRGPFSCSGGEFAGQFIVPLDISYGGELGRISIYYNDGETDGCAFVDSIYLGSGGTPLSDSDLPAAAVYFSDRSYRAGDPIPVSPVIIADLYDSSGINLTGSAGHQIMLIADESEEYDLTDFFEYDIDSHSQGTLTHQLDYLAPGVHNMKLNVWDSFNNLQQIEFTVETAEMEADGEYLYDLLNYPNPFNNTTSFTFKILEAAEVEIEVYTVGGRKIQSFGPKYCLPVYVYDDFIWDGRDYEGDKIANGVYLYKVIARFDDNTVSKIGKIIVMQ